MNETHKGGCHCGAIEFEFASADVVTVYRCNCSICQMTGYLHLIIPKVDFKLIRGNPSSYTFNSHIAKHHFCATCGIKSYYVPRSNPDGISINFRCIDESTFTQVAYAEFDGQDWEANVASIEHLSKPPL